MGVCCVGDSCLHFGLGNSVNSDVGVLFLLGGGGGCVVFGIH